MSDCRRYDTLVAAALRRLGLESTAGSLTSRLLAGGLSGSSVHYLHLAGRAMVLKVTTPHENRHLIVRAHREALFYQDLAALVPMRVPRVLALDLNETEGATILLAAYAPAPSPDTWTERSYVQVAQQMGRFHATFWGKTAMAILPDWLREKSRISPARCRDAAQGWRALGNRTNVHTVTERLRHLERLVLRMPALDRQMVTLPVTLCHGDCHIGNLLRDPDGEWIWADWQDVRLGPGVDDLAFFWQRAFVAAETPPPYDAMVQAYGASLVTTDDHTLTREECDRALAWSELRSWLVDWPRYLEGLPMARLERVLQRIDMLINRFELANDL